MSNDTTTSSGKNTPLSQLLGFEDGDFVTVATNKVQRARTISVDELDAEYEMGLLDQQDTWIGAQPVKPGTPDKRTKASDVACVRVLYADFDLKDSTDPAQIDRAISQLSLQIGVEPISVVNSGGGLHPRWKLAKPIESADAKGVLGRWQLTVQRIAEENGFKADSVFDLPRVLRLPGTVNEKYSPAAEVTITARDTKATVPTAAVWSKLDQHPTKLKGEKKTAPKADEEKALNLDEADLAPAPAKPERRDTLNERAVNASLTKDTAELRALMDNAEPWHNTVRDVAFRMAKAGLSPETTISIDEVEKMFLEAVPRDDTEEWDADVEKLWESALERADGEIYELIGSGDELFGETVDEFFAGAAAEAGKRDKADLPPELSLDDVDNPEAPEAPLAPAHERYEALTLPLVPGFSGASAIRTLELTDASRGMLDKIRVVGEDIADMHVYEHDEYLHPHCPACFPDSWRQQLHRWFVRNPRIDPAGIHPPMGRLAPGEGYMSGIDLLGIADSQMLIDGWLPANAIGLIIGRGGGGKTFMALDMALHITDPSKDSWSPTELSVDEEAGGVNEHGGALIFAGEGFRGFKSRTRAWLRSHGYGDTPDSAPEWLSKLTIREEVPNFFAGGLDYELLLEEVSKTKPKVIIIDTLQKAAAGSDQNSASDMAIVHGHLSRLKSAADGATIIVIAHSTKEDTGVRGSSALEDDSDFVLHVKANESMSKPNELSMPKARDNEAPAPLDFYLVPVGNSVVVSPRPTSSVSQHVNERARIEVMSAMLALHAANSFDSEITKTELVKQVQSVPAHEVTEILGSVLIPAAHVVRSGEKKYMLTPKGRVWIESKSAALFAASRGQ